MSDPTPRLFGFELVPLLVNSGLVVLVLALAILPAWRRRSWRTFGLGLVVSVFGVLLPVAVFVLSGIFAPDWKGNAPHGWVDTLHEGKIALLPLVLWATVSLYAYEMSLREKRDRPWALVGIVVGAVVSLVCLGHGLLTIPLEKGKWGFAIPFYVALWYGWRAVAILRAGVVRTSIHLYTLLGTGPFWVASVLLARHFFRELPDDPPTCFVASAAARGHVGFVASWPETDRDGRAFAMNRQLAVFWCLEDLGRRRTPRVHAAFRRVYDVWGYRASRLVRSPWVADAVYCALKPFELAALALLAFARR